MSVAHKIDTSHESAHDEIERLDQLARQRASEIVKARRLHTMAPRNMDGTNDGRTKLDEAPEDVERGTRGCATLVVVEVMLSGPCTREDILEALRREFPEKTDKVLKNTMGSLLHSIPIRRNWKIEKKTNPKDARKPTYVIVDFGLDSAEYKEKYGENRIRAGSQEGAHADTIAA